jgi:hypothetical protein
MSWLRQDAELLLVGERHGGAAIVEHGGPRREHGTPLHLATRQAVGGGLYHLELGDGGVAQAGDLGEALRRSGDGLGERAELGDQRLGEGLHVAPRQGPEQHQLEQFVFGHRVAAGLAEAGAKPLAMPVIMRGSLLRTAFGRFPLRLTAMTSHRRCSPVDAARMTARSARLHSPIHSLPPRSHNDGHRPRAPSVRRKHVDPPETGISA